MNNECVMGLLSQFRVDLVPILVPALEENANRHWNPSVHTLTISVRKFIQEMDKDLYERVHPSRASSIEGASPMDDDVPCGGV